MGLKYAFMSFSTPRMSLAEILSCARSLGYDGIEPRAASGHLHGVEIDADADQRSAIRRQIEASGMALACIATSGRYADPSTAKSMVEETRRYIDLAGDLGCSRLRVFGGEYPQTVSRQQATTSLIESLRQVVDHAGRRRVTLCMETHDAWTNPSEVAEVMRRVNHPAIAVNWDIMHTLRQSKIPPAQAYETLRPWIRHVHVHDGLDRLDRLEVVAIGTGNCDHAPVIRLLAQGRYDGFISGEWIESIMDPAFFASHLGPELATLKRLERQVEMR